MAFRPAALSFRLRFGGADTGVSGVLPGRSMCRSSVIWSSSRLFFQRFESFNGGGDNLGR